MASMLIIAGIAVVLLVLLAWSLRPPRNRARSGESICGKCGYIVTGLPTFTCPECGSDLREVGIKTVGPMRLGWVRPVMLLVAWTGLWVLVWWVGFGAIDAYFWPYEFKNESQVELIPRSGEYKRVIVEEDRSKRYLGRAHFDVAPWKTWRITFRLEKERGKESVMTVEPLRGMAWSFTDSNGKLRSGTTIDEPAVWGWMIDAGADAPSPAVKDEADALVKLAQDAAGQYASLHPVEEQSRMEMLAQFESMPAASDYAFADFRPVGQSMYRTQPRVHINYLALPLCLAAWFAGIWRFRRRFIAPAKPRHRVLSILFTDIKDYTNKTEAASREELANLLAINRKLVEAAVNARGGQIVKSIGDALLATFESATNAVLAGLEIQRCVRDHNASAPNPQKLELRVAVSTGEVLMDHNDVFGTAVNIASRVQGLANAGEVYFTESTYHAMISAEVGFVEVGQRELKGIDRPVKVFRAVELPPADSNRPA